MSQMVANRYRPQHIDCALLHPRTQSTCSYRKFFLAQTCNVYLVVGLERGQIKFTESQTALEFIWDHTGAPSSKGS